MEPDDEDGLEGIVPGDVEEDETKGETLHEIEEAKDDPVCEPLDVVVGGRGLDCLEGEIGGEAPAYEVGDGCGKGVEGVENEEEGDPAKDDVSLGDLGALLQGDEGGVLGELREGVRTWVGETW